MKRALEKFAPALAAAGRSAVQTGADTAIGRPNGEVAGAAAQRLRAGSAAPGLPPPRQTAVSAAAMGQPGSAATGILGARGGTAALLRMQSVRRAAHGAAAAPASAAIAQSMSRIDHAFGHHTSDADQHKALDAIEDSLRTLQQLPRDNADPKTRLDLHRATGAALAFGRDAPDLTEAVVKGEVKSMAALREMMDDSLITRQLDSPPPETKGLTPDESMALGLYSVRLTPSSETKIAPQVFRAVNTAMGMDMPQAKEKLQFLIDPLTSGMNKLPALNGATLFRGMVVADADDKEALREMAKQFQPGESVTLPAPTPGSQKAGYPGNLLFVMQSAADHSRLRDTSAFSYAKGQQEGTFLPGTSFKVVSSALTTVDESFAKSDPLVESSGRSWGNAVGKPLVLVTLQEQPKT
jgi:hypothetical protein